MHYKDVITEMMVPYERVASVIDTFNTIGEVLELREKVIKGVYFGKDDFDKLLMRLMYVLGFYPFYKAYGETFRPILLEALESDTPIDTFFTAAIPTALTIAMPHNQDKYYEYREIAKKKLKAEYNDRSDSKSRTE